MEPTIKHYTDDDVDQYLKVVQNSLADSRDALEGLLEQVRKGINTTDPSFRRRLESNNSTYKVSCLLEDALLLLIKNRADNKTPNPKPDTQT